MGPWTRIGKPCVGEHADKTFYGQSTFILPIQGYKDAYMAMFDKWNKTDLINSTYIWLPIEFDDKGGMIIRWRDSWDIKNEWK